MHMLEVVFVNAPLSSATTTLALYICYYFEITIGKITNGKYKDKEGIVISPDSDLNCNIHLVEAKLDT